MDYNDLFINNLEQLQKNEITLVYTLVELLNNKNRIEKESLIEVESLAYLPEINNHLLDVKSDYEKNAYFTLLTFVLLQLPDNCIESISTYKRLLLGIKPPYDLESYKKRAYLLKMDELTEYIAYFKDDEIKYRFIIDSIVICGDNLKQKKIVQLISYFCEILNIEVEEAKHLFMLAHSILTNNADDYWRIVSSNKSAVRNDVASDYMKIGNVETEELFNKASELFRMYHFKEAIPILIKLANARYSRAYALLYWIYIDGYYKDGIYLIDKQRAEECLKRGYENGDIVTSMLYALFYERNRELIKEILPKLKELAVEGDIFAEYTLGIVSLHDIGDGRNCYEAAEHFISSAKSGFYRAIGSMFRRYKDGDGYFNKNWLELSLWADELLRYQNVNDNYGYEVFDIAHAYMCIEEYSCTDEIIKEHFYKKAIKLWENLICLGSPGAATNLGWMYEIGVGTKKNESQAFKYYQKAAKGGDSVGQCNLGLAYANGRGCEVDREKAIYWYKESAKQGNQRAKDILKELGIKI